MACAGLDPGLDPPFWSDLATNLRSRNAKCSCTAPILPKRRAHPAAEYCPLVVPREWRAISSPTSPASASAMPTTQARLGRHGGGVRQACGRGRRPARRRAGHARERAARSRHDGRADRRHHARRRLGVRARCRLRRAGLAARTGPRLCGPRGAGADRAGRDPVRSAERRRQEMGPLSRPTASLAMRPRRRRRRSSRSAARARDLARPPSISRAASARRRPRRAAASRSARWRWSMPRARR